MSAPRKENVGKKSHAADIPLSEWIIGAAGLLIVAATIGGLIYEGFAGDKSPPDIKLSVQAIAPQRNGYVVKVRAENEGGEAAARVGIKVELLKEAKVIETRETQFEYLPARSTRAAGVFFSADPRQGELRLEASGYEEP